MDRRASWLRGAAARLGIALLLAAAPGCAAEPGAFESIAVTAEALGWEPQAELSSADKGSHDYFGDAVAISGDTLVVGARYATANGISAGNVHVFVRSGAVWALQATLVAGDGAENDSFGFAVGLSGDTLVVGAFRNGYTYAESRGAAYVFERSGTTWTRQAKLVAADGVAEDRFGYSVGISGDTIVVGARYDDESASVTASGSAYVFVRNGATWTQQAKLVASDPASGDQLGQSVAVSGDTIVAGAFRDDESVIVGDTGSAYVFVRNGATWTQQAKLVAEDRAEGDQLGQAVAVVGDTIVATAYGDDSGKIENAGSAYVFERTGEHWDQRAKLVADDGAAEDHFGFSVAMDGDAIVVGSIYADSGGATDSGAAYVFERSGATFRQQAKLAASGDTAQQRLGFAVGISGATLVAGAPTAEGAGSAHVFALHRDDGASCADAVCDPGSDDSYGSYYSCAATPGRRGGSSPGLVVMAALALAVRAARLRRRTRQRRNHARSRR